MSQIGAVEAVEDHTVHVHTKGPFPTLINLSDIPIEPKGYFSYVSPESLVRRSSR